MIGSHLCVWLKHVLAGFAGGFPDFSRRGVDVIDAPATVAAG
ncbi:hypothetical protein [Arthrobacter polaris]|nr:hypothetical protein [Arthrobacter polaris]